MFQTTCGEKKNLIRFRRIIFGHISTPLYSQAFNFFSLIQLFLLTLYNFLYIYKIQIISWRICWHSNDIKRFKTTCGETKVSLIRFRRLHLTLKHLRFFLFQLFLLKSFISHFLVKTVAITIAKTADHFFLIQTLFQFVSFKNIHIFTRYSFYRVLLIRIASK